MKLIRHARLSGERRFSDVAHDRESTLDTTDWSAKIFRASPVDVWKHRYTVPTTGKPRVCVEIVHAIPPDGTESEVWIFDVADITPEDFDESLKKKKENV